MDEKLSEGIPVKKTNKSSVPKIKFVDLNIWSRDLHNLEIMLVSRLAKREDSINPAPF